MVASNTTMGGVSRSLTYLVDKDGNRLQVTHPDGNYFTYSYDKLDRMLQLRELGVSTLAANVYNPQGARGSTSRVGASIAYGYDTLVRLTSLTNNLAGTSGDLSFGFGYNPASQITTRTRSNDAFVYGGDVNVSRLYSVNGLNQYLSAGPASFSYDSNGNLTSDGSVNYGFDAENRLISASGARSAALAYDPLGRLHSTSGGSAGETRFLYDGDELIAEYDGAGTLLRRYVHGPLADDPMVWYEGASVAAAARRQMFTDHQGSVVAVADSVGALLRANSYDDWGTPGATNLGRFGYTGQAWIPEIGLFHYKARAYSPTLGRFLQTDPVGYDDQVNLYAYVGNDPVNNVDPAGTDGEEVTEGEEIIATADPCRVKPSSCESIDPNDIIFINIGVPKNPFMEICQIAYTPNGDTKGENPDRQGDRYNTDLPGGYEAALATFAGLTRLDAIKNGGDGGSHINFDPRRPTTTHLSNTGNIGLRYAFKNGELVFRVDINANTFSLTKAETIHFNGSGRGNMCPTR